jgi:hypothetical protein
LQLVQERAGNTLEAIGIGNDFLSRTQLAQQLRERNQQMGIHEIISKLKRLSTEWGKIFARCALDKGLVTRIHQELKKLNSPKKSMTQ